MAVRLHVKCPQMQGFLNVGPQEERVRDQCPIEPMS